MRPPVLTQPDPVDSAYVSDRLTALAHELANLIDGSLRCICLARRAVARTGAGQSPPPAHSDRLPAVHATESNPQPDVTQVSRHLETVHAAMQQMAQLVRASMGGFSPGLMVAVNAAVGSGGGLSEAVRHAVAVMQPIADEHGIDLVSEVDPRLNDVPAGPVYTIVTSAVRNAIESIQRARPCSAAGDAPTPLVGAGGIVRVQARLDNRMTPEIVEIEVIDDGAGPPAGIDGGTERLFEFGVTTKPRGTGIGLAVTRDAVEELGGTVRLTRRQLDARTSRGGAVLGVRFPCPGAMDDGHGG